MAYSTISRRQFLVVGASTVLGTTATEADAQAWEFRGGEPWLPHQADAPSPNTDPRYIFFTPAEVVFVEAATERICPQDGLGPGAKTCGVAFFIDHQLAGAYGRAQSWYMYGPWPKGQDTQGFQSRLAPADLYRAGIKAIDRHVSSTEGVKAFAELPPDKQDAVLSGLENGKIELDGADAKTFFKMLLLNTKEGMFCDPIYGGNRDMAGWKMLGFPGARYNYLDWVGRHGERYDQPPVGLNGRPDWNEGG